MIHIQLITRGVCTSRISSLMHDKSINQGKHLSWIAPLMLHKPDLFYSFAYLCWKGNIAQAGDWTHDLLTQRPTRCQLHQRAKLAGKGSNHPGQSQNTLLHMFNENNKTNYMQNYHKIYKIVHNKMSWNAHEILRKRNYTCSSWDPDLPSLSARPPPRKAPIMPPGIKMAVVTDHRNVNMPSLMPPYRSVYVLL